MSCSINISTTRIFDSPAKKQAWLARLERLAEKYQDTLEIKLVRSEENSTPATATVVLSPKNKTKP